MAVFAAGAVVLRSGELVLTLNGDDLPAGAGDTVRVGWVGGALEPGETPRDCLAREAVEELGVPVDVVPTPETLAWDWAVCRLEPVEVVDGDRPLLLVRRADGREAVVYRATVDAGAPLRPGDDVLGVLVLPVALWPLVERGCTLEQAVSTGASAIVESPLPATTRLWLHPQAFLRPAVPLVAA